MTSSGRLLFTQRFILTATVGMVVLLSATLFAEAESRGQAQLTIKRVALFKNGLGYFTSETVLPKKATTVEFGQLPVPSLGTFWVGYPEKVQVHSLITSMEETEETVPIHAVFQLLEANIGSKVQITTSQKDAIIKGTVASVISNQDPIEPPSPYVMGIRRDQHNRQYYPYGKTPVALIKTDTGLVAVNAASIIRVDFEGDAVKTEIVIKSKRPSLRMELKKTAGGNPVSVSYLARGVTWSPSYLIDLSDPETARLSAKALVINEVADLDGVVLELVTGFPNIQFAEVTSPMAMSQDLAGFLKALTTGRSESRRGSRGYMMGQQAMLSNAARYEESSSAPIPSYSTAKEGSVSEDLFLYPVKDFHLQRGDTATVPLFTAELPYKHIYTWKIDDILDKDERYRRNRDEKEKAEEVWHSCRITNNMKMPWTTAAAQFVKNGNFTGQDICYYTAPGSETTIRINRAMNVIAEEAEVELERKRNAAKFYGYNYDLVKVKGELKIRSRLNKAVNIEVTKYLSGKVLLSSPEAKDTPTAKGLKRVNPRHVLQWEMELGPDDKKVLTYTYELYIRN